MLAFLDQTGAVHTVDVATGDVQQIFAATFEPGRPTWSPDGRVVALAAIKPYSARYREGLSKILLIDRTTGAGTYVDPLPFRSIQTRGDDGPAWSPDGTKMAFVVASVLWVVDVHPDGTFAGTPRQITTEVTDAPTWSGDSSELLYLNNGRLRIVSVDGRSTRTVPVGLTWTNSRPRGRTVIHAGRMWDGVSRSLQRDVDITVEGHRITAVEPHRVGRDGQLVDVMKCYVRLPTEWQQEVIDWAHQRKVHASSHYHYPAFAFGGDGMEHIGATNRFGYSRTITALGTGYSDVIDIFNGSQAVRAPTLFVSSTLYRDDTSLVTDRRVTTLYPSWEYASLQAAVTTAKTTDQTVTRANLAAQVAQIVAMVARRRPGDHRHRLADRPHCGEHARAPAGNGALRAHPV
jgi:WD40-like Beta Propeller Repeat